MPSLKTQLLYKVRSLVTKGWTQGAYARNSEGVNLESDHPMAVCWCLSGAFVRACYDMIGSLFEKPLITTKELTDLSEAYDEARLAVMLKIRSLTFLKYESIVSFNDSSYTTKEQVIALLDIVIKDLA